MADMPSAQSSGEIEAVKIERARWLQLILQADELGDPERALAALVNMARVEYDRMRGGT